LLFKIPLFFEKDNPAKIRLTGELRWARRKKQNRRPAKLGALSHKTLHAFKNRLIGDKNCPAMRTYLKDVK